MAEIFGTGASVQNIWRERFGAVPFEDKGGFWQARYYQHRQVGGDAIGANKALHTRTTMLLRSIAAGE